MPTQNSQGTEAEPAPELSAQVVTKLACVDLLCLDVDGVLTDGALYYSSQGEELKAFYTQDGSALKRLQASGVILAIISGRRSEMVRRRAAELGIEHLYEGQEDKVPALMELSSITGVDVANIAHVGDDIPDIALFDIVGCALTVADGHPQVRAGLIWWRAWPEAEAPCENWRTQLFLAELPLALSEPSLHPLTWVKETVASTRARSHVEPSQAPNRQSPLALVLAISALLAAGTLWLQGNRTSESGAQSLPPELQDEPDLYIDTAVIQQFRDDGSRKYLLLAERVRHFENREDSQGHGQDDKQLTRLQSPDLLLSSVNADPWHATANYGYVRTRHAPDGTPEEVVFLRANVELSQQRQPPASLLVRSRSMYLYPDREFVETSESVTIDTHTGRTTGSSMRGNLSTGVLRLSGDTTQVQTIVLPSQFK